MVTADNLDSLLARAKAKEVGSFERLCAYVLPAVHRMVTTSGLLKNPDDVDEVTQEVMVHLVDRFPEKSFETAPHLIKYLSLVARSRSLDRLRRQSVRRVTSLDGIEIASFDGDGLAIDDYLDSLPDRLREVVRQAAMGQTTAQTAAIMGVSVRTVQRDLADAVARLHDAFGDGS